MKKVNKGEWNRYQSNNMADKKRAKVWHCRPTAANVPRPPKRNSAGGSDAGRSASREK